MSRELEIRQAFINERNPDFFFKVREFTGKDGRTYYEVVNSVGARLGVCNDREYAVMFSLSGRLWEYLNLMSVGYRGLVDEFNAQFDNRLKNQEA